MPLLVPLCVENRSTEFLKQRLSMDIQRVLMVPSPEKSDRDEKPQVEGVFHQDALQKAQAEIAALKLKQTDLIHRLELAEKDLQGANKVAELTDVICKTKLDNLVLQHNNALQQRDTAWELTVSKLKLQHYEHLSKVQTELAKAKSTYAASAGLAWCRKFLEWLDAKFVDDFNLPPSWTRKDHYEFVINSRLPALRALLQDCILFNSSGQYSTKTTPGSLVNEIYGDLCGYLHSFDVSVDMVIPVSSLPLNDLKKSMLRRLLEFYGYHHDHLYGLDRKMLRHSLEQHGVAKVSVVVKEEDLKWADSEFAARSESRRQTVASLSNFGRDTLLHSNIPQFIGGILGWPCVRPFCVQFVTRKGFQQQRATDPYECELSRMPIEGQEVITALLSMDYVPKNVISFGKSSHQLGIKEQKMSLPFEETKCHSYFKPSRDRSELLSFAFHRGDLVLYDARILKEVKLNGEKYDQGLLYIHWIGPRTYVIERRWTCDPALTTKEKRSIDSPAATECPFFPVVLVDQGAMQGLFMEDE